MSKLKVCLHNDSIEIIGTKRKFTYINTHINANGNLVKITANREISNKQTVNKQPSKTIETPKANSQKQQNQKPKTNYK